MHPLIIKKRVVERGGEGKRYTFCIAYGEINKWLPLMVKNNSWVVSTQGYQGDLGNIANLPGPLGQIWWCQCTWTYHSQPGFITATSFRGKTPATTGVREPAHTGLAPGSWLHAFPSPTTGPLCCAQGRGFHGKLPLTNLIIDSHWWVEAPQT